MDMANSKSGQKNPVPMVNLRLAVEETRGEWEMNLEQTLDCSTLILGKHVQRFEEEFAAWLGARAVVGVGAGAGAIELCLRAAGLSAKREVMTTSLTSLFTAQAILCAGLTPRFGDVDPDTLLLDPGDVENRITKRTGAVTVVHLYGQPCPLDRFRGLARTLKLALVQDACQAHGATWGGRPLTAYSPYVAYSFYPTKNLGCLGDGGAVATSSHRIAGRLRLLRDGGRKGDQVARIPAVNSRLDEMQAGFLRAFLPRLVRWNEQRLRLAELYDKSFADVPGVRVLRRPVGSVVHLYVLRAERRDKLRRFLAARGIATGIHYPLPLHLHPAFQISAMRRGDLPHAEKACKEIVSLPLWPQMSDDMIGRVADGIRAFYLGA
jgi:dTDP-4-amino-4,6-dideoxygalactose transaminase